MSRSLSQWLGEYQQSHRHPTNILIHKIFVPVILYSLLAFLWALPFPFIGPHFGINWANLLTLFSLIFYFSLGMLPGFMMALCSIPFLLALHFLGASHQPLIAKISLGLFLISWIFQFIGHKLEAKKPAFFQDLLFLLIGPLWVLAKAFK